MKKTIFLMNFMLHAFIYAQVGVGTDKPKATLDVEGEVRISEKFRKNLPKALTQNAVPLYVDQNSGIVKYAPAGFTRVSGGFRPGGEFTITKLPLKNTIVRIRFILHIDESNPINNADDESYVYGDLVIIGTGSDNPTKFVEFNLKDSSGNPKPILAQTPTEIRWLNGSQLETRIFIDQTSGDLKINNKVTVLSYLFEIFGGI